MSLTSSSTFLSLSIIPIEVFVFEDKACSKVISFASALNNPSFRLFVVISKWVRFDHRTPKTRYFLFARI